MSDAGKIDNFPCRRITYFSTQSGSIHYPYLILLLTCLFSQVSSSPTPEPHISYHNGLPTTSLYDHARTFNVRVIAATCAAVSMTASFIAFYWFCRMEKRFRHRLIMLLIYGDLMRASWLFIFAIVSIARGTVTTYSSFCQASGFLVQYGMETSDYSILVIAIHSALQVFRPSVTANLDGLYPYRYYVYVSAFIVPVFMAGMAFVNPHWGYMSQGTFCTLPIRPFWYRLALAWIPRYLIAIIILGLAVAIYTHVGFAFHSFSHIGQSIKPPISTITPMLSVCDVEEGRAGGLEPSNTVEQHSQTILDRRASFVVHEVFPSQRRASAVAFIVDKEDSYHPHERRSRSQSVPTSPRNSIVPIHAVLSDIPLFAPQTPYQEPSRPTSRNLSPLSNCPVLHVQRQLAEERARIHRQLRLMFIYPLTYILMWIIPFVSHCMLYRDKWAAHPVYWLTMMSTICITLMGAVDCLVFSLRERPWRHMVGSDGTFWGSFVCWRRSSDRCTPRRMRESDARLSRSFADTVRNVNHNIRRGGEVEAEGEAKRQMCMRMGRTEESFMGSVSVAAQSMGTIRSSDIRTADRDGARQRLECEREDRRVEKARREMGGQEGERWDEVSLEEGLEVEEGNEGRNESV